MTLTCPQCKGDLVWEGGTHVAPDVDHTVYSCHNPDCGLVTLAVKVLE